MKIIRVFPLLLFMMFGTSPLFAGPATYPDELIGKVKEWKTLAMQKKEMPQSLPGISVVSTDEAEKLWKSNTVTFLDTRPKPVYENGKIPGAGWLFSDDLLKDPETAGKLDKSKEYVLYCNGERCWRAAGVAILLRHLGFEKLVWYRDGIPGWKKRGLPTETAAKPVQ